MTVYDIKVGRCSQLNNNIKLYEYQYKGRGHLLTLVQISQNSILFVSSITTTRVVNVGTSSKMCQRNFHPTPHSGTFEIVPTLRNE